MKGMEQMQREIRVGESKWQEKIQESTSLYVAFTHLQPAQLLNQMSLLFLLCLHKILLPLNFSMACSCYSVMMA